MNDHLPATLSHLPEPAPSATLKTTVMARIAREADRATPSIPAPGSALAKGRERMAWLLALAGLALVMGAVAQGYLESGALPDLTSARIGLSRVAVMPMEGAAQLVVALGALVYLAGMFAPLRSREGR